MLVAYQNMTVKLLVQGSATAVENEVFGQRHNKGGGK